MTESTAQRSYLKKITNYKRRITILQISILLLIIVLWEVFTRLGILNSFIFSSPGRMIKALYQMILSGKIFIHTGITFAETLVSFLLVITIGMVVAIIMWSNKTISDTIEPYLVTLNSLPKSALAPVLIVWLGTGYKSIVITAISVSLFGTILSLYTSFAETEMEKIRLITTLGGTRKDVLTKLILPSSLPIIISCMKVNIGLCLVGVIIAEFLVANAGLGYVIIYNSQIFKMDYVLLSICILCLMSSIIYKAVNILEGYVHKKF